MKNTLATLENEILAYTQLPFVFNEFLEFPSLTDGVLTLRIAKLYPAVPDRQFVPSYEFDILLDQTVVGNIKLRIGYSTGLYYGGNIGYNISPEYRGHGYAARACQLLRPVLKAHQMTTLCLTTDSSNLASQRVCEKIGAQLQRITPIPSWHHMTQTGHQEVLIYYWSVD